MSRYGVGLELGWSSVGVRVGSDWSWVRVTRSRLARVRSKIALEI